MNKILFSLAALVSLSGAGADLAVVPKLDLSRYLGVWYDIAHKPAPFQSKCFATTATYSRREDGDIAVLNQCRWGSFEGELHQATARAWVVDRETNAKLKVQFFWPFRGNYWVLEVGHDYEYAVVGEPRRKYLWVLSRTPTLAPEKLDAILERAKGRGYELGDLIRTPQRL